MARTMRVFMVSYLAIPRRTPPSVTRPSEPIRLTGEKRSAIPGSSVTRRYYIHTFGCQMNESDSLRMGEALARAGWDATQAAESADLVLVNTCAIREKAEDKLFSALGRHRPP